MLRKLLLNGVAIGPLYAAEGEGTGEGDSQLPLESGDPGASGQAGEGAAAGADGGDGTNAGAAAEGAATAEEQAAAAEAAKAEASKTAAARRKANAPKWAMDEITTQRAARRAAEEATAAKDREIENLRQMVERSAKDGTGAATTTTTGAPQRTNFANKEEFDRAVETAAQQREFARSTQDVFDAGIKDFEDFQESLNIMTAVGATSDEFAADLVAVDKTNAHKIIHELAQTPELSKRLVAMSSRQRVAELTKMSMKLSEPGAKAGVRQVSRAAAPLRALEGSAGTDENDFGDNVPDDVWSSRFDKKFGLNGAQR